MPMPWAARQWIARLLVLLADENAEPREREQQLRREQTGLREWITDLEAERDRLAVHGDRLEQANARLRECIEALRRTAKRQAAPFSRDTPIANPNRPGRKVGAAHGRHGHRQPPHPSRSTGWWWSGCRLAVPAAAASWSASASRPRMSRSCPHRGRSASATTSRSAVAARVAGGSSPATPGRPPMRWARRAANLALGRWRWRRGCPRAWGSRPPQTNSERLIGEKVPPAGVQLEHCRREVHRPGGIPRSRRKATFCG